MQNISCSFLVVGYPVVNLSSLPCFADVARSALTATMAPAARALPPAVVLVPALAPPAVLQYPASVPSARQQGV